MINGGKFIVFTMCILLIQPLPYSFGKGIIFIFDYKNNVDDNWNRTYEGNFTVEDIEEALDGGYILVGSTYFDGNETADAWIMKLDENGDVEWSKTFGGKGFDIFMSVVVAEDGYIAVGILDYFGNTSDAWVIKVDKEGDEEWSKTFGGERVDAALSIKKSEEGFIIAGMTESFGFPDDDAWLIKIDKDGNEIWNKTYGVIGIDLATDIEVVEDGYIFAGSVWPKWENRNARLIKVDNDGNVIWQKEYDKNGYEAIHSLRKTPDGYILAGFTVSDTTHNENAWLIKVDKKGNEIWNKEYPANNASHVYDVEIADSGYLFVGYTLAGDISNGWMVRVDENGYVEYNRTFTQFEYSSINVIKKVSGGYILAGDIAPAGKEGALLIKYTPDPTHIWVKIKRPKENHLYFNDREIIPISKTVIIGKITIEVDVYSEVGINKIEFFVDGKIKYIAQERPYAWLWDEKVIGSHKIKICAYNREGYSKEAKTNILILNFW